MFMQIHCNGQHHLATKANTRVDPTKNEKVNFFFVGLVVCIAKCKETSSHLL